VDGSVEAILDVIDTYDDQERCKLSLIHYGVGNITETDVEMAHAFEGFIFSLYILCTKKLKCIGIIYAFNVNVPKKVKEVAAQKGVKIKPHNIIYKLVDDIKEEVTQRLPIVKVEESVGS
jgi:translation initiation factor IF-2